MGKQLSRHVVARHKDANHNEIRNALRKAGYYTVETHRVGFGFPDLLCVSKSRIAVVLEVKDGAEGLNENEEIFFNECHAPKEIVRSPEGAIKAMEFWDGMEVV